MEQSQYSDASSYTHSLNCNPGPFCHCNKATMMSKSWTNENPGRRFFRCDVHGFSSWADKENPHGWQKVSLIEARDEIGSLKEELTNLRANIPKR
ncbi:unnamed protein product [Microthlaspi erraticum]|uniref:DUF7900 domain-containing protein n=1 Tax=Microthlaspi erraticum TaxID=1685480 RepID=A0A6D2IAI7_9BRAS|nr:unnamed protein product [Microthlaspi erraticum]